MKNYNLLVKDFKQNGLNFKKDEKLSGYTTIGIGGNTKLLVKVIKVADLELAVRLAVKHHIPYRVLGKGSNIIVSDAGYDGLIILNCTNSWQLMSDISKRKRNYIPARFKTLQTEYFSGNALISSWAKHNNEVIVRVDSGMRLSHLINTLFKVGITGLEYFAGIPGTVGGAIYMNIHGGEYYFGGLVNKVNLTDGRTSREEGKDYFHFDYDWSILHQTGEIILSADLSLNKGDVKKAREYAKNWMGYKSRQPQKSAGCIFQNLSSEEQNKFNLPTSSVGYIIDHILQLKGTRIGDAIISQAHAAFIENLGKATAGDVMELIELV